MSCEEIVLIDSEDENPINNSNNNKTVEEVVLTDSSDSDVLIENQIIKNGVEFIGRGYRSVFRKPRKERNKNRKNGSNDAINTEHLISSDSDQSNLNSVHKSNGLKNELITPPKDPPNNQLFKSSPNFDSPNQSSSQPLIQISNDSQSSSQVLEPIPPEIPNQSSVITSTLSSFSVDPRLALPSEDLSDISPIEEPIDGTEDNDFGVEAENDCTNISTHFEPTDPLRSPTLLERSSTPISTTNVMSSDCLLPNRLSQTLFQKNFIKHITETLNVGHTSDESLINTQINGKTIESITESVPKEDQTSKKEISVRTKNVVKTLTFDENETIEAVEPTAEYYICSYFDCGQEFNNAVLHYKHEKKHFNELLRRNIRTFECHYKGCPFMALTQIDLMYHNSEHLGIFLCTKSECKFRGKSAKEVDVHMRSHRTAKRRALRKKGLLGCDCSEPCCQPNPNSRFLKLN